jgi:hypothetical protein
LEGAAICDQDANGKTCYLVRRIQDKQIKITNFDNSKGWKSDGKLRPHIRYPT